MGQSAGASSILHHVTAGGGKEVDRPAFDAAILQSPGFFPQPNNTKNDLAYSRFLHLAGAEDLADLKGKDTAVLQQANAIMTYESEYGYFNFGPTVDGDYVPDLPGRLLAAGDFHTGISMLTGHQALDGLLFTPPWIRTNAGLAQHSQDLYPGIPPEVLSNISSRYHIDESWLNPAQSRIGVVSDFLDVSNVPTFE
jgi:carboxylesterase type B